MPSCGARFDKKIPITRGGEGLRSLHRSDRGAFKAWELISDNSLKASPVSPFDKGDSQTSSLTRLTMEFALNPWRSKSSSGLPDRGIS